MAIQQLNEVTQRNASAAEEMATSSEELASQAQELESTISFFKVDEKAVNKTKVKDRSAAKLPKSEGEKSDAGYAISFDGDAVNDEDFEAYK
jgi:methyl-accepting chemotaxis protein